MGLRRLWQNRAKAPETDSFPDIYSLASDETLRGGYLVTEDPDSPVLILTAVWPKYSDGTGSWQYLPVSAPGRLRAKDFCLIGGPGDETCEVVRVEEEPVPGKPLRVRRQLFRTVAPKTHPAGTWVRRVTVARIFDWARWEAAQQAEPADPGPDTQ